MQLHLAAVMIRMSDMPSWQPVPAFTAASQQMRLLKFYFGVSISYGQVIMVPIGFSFEKIEFPIVVGNSAKRFDVARSKSRFWSTLPQVIMKCYRC